MNNLSIYRLHHLSVVDVTGADAAAIVHNLTTNEVKKLVVGEGRETFITDVRGKTLGHGFLYRHDDRFRLIGSPGQSERIASHADKYTIREDAVPSVRDDAFAAWVIPSAVSSAMKELHPPSSLAGPIATWTTLLDDVPVQIFQTRMLGEGTYLLLAPIESAEQAAASLLKLANGHLPGLVEATFSGSEADFHTARIAAGFPWYGVDLTDANLPQEADRDAVSISFTKGCYLGQETVARLDALGQVQKKLVRWSIAGDVPPPDTTIDADGKTVGRLTSVTPTGGQTAIALGFARRSHFGAGATASGTNPETGNAFTATVLSKPSA